MRRAPVRAPCLSLLIITPPNPHDAYRIWPVYGVLYTGCMLTHGDWDEFRQVRGMADKVGLWARFTAYDLVERGKSAINSGKYQRALELCEQAIATNPQSADAWFTLGWALLKLETRNEDAAAAFERAIALKPHNPWAWNNIGVLRHRAKQLDAALDAYRSWCQHGRPKRMCCGRWGVRPRQWRRSAAPASWMPSSRRRVWIPYSSLVAKARRGVWTCPHAIWI